jgi:D-glycero-alpha-D-manno-heptose-7-phosphate kinase
MPDKRRLAVEAIRVEQEMVRENVGSQDQVTAAYGGFNRIEFLADGSFSVAPVVLEPARLEELQRRLMLVFTGFARTASEVAAAQVRATPSRTAELTRTYELVDAAVEVLRGGGDLDEFGRLLHEAWLLKRSLTDRISNAAIDGIYEAARRAGALGGKLLGAGGGGFMVLWVPPERQAAVRAALKELLHVPFRFEPSGSQIIFYDPAAMIRLEEAP